LKVRSGDGLWEPYGLEGAPQTRDEAAAADRNDPLAGYREQFVIEDGGPIYMDGNSLGRQPRSARAAVGAVVDQWATELVGGWRQWVDLASIAGDEIGELVGARAGQVIVGDSTTVNLYKLALSALSSRPERPVVVVDADDFPTVRYVLRGIAAATGRQLRWLRRGREQGIDLAELEESVDERVALVCLSGVNFRSGAVAGMRAVDRIAHKAGALVLWDLSHAAGAVPVQLDDDEADLAVGCGYKYLNGGPGAPAWLYVSARLQDELRSPIWGWWGQAAQFEMGPAYDPLPGIQRFQAGTPPIIGIAALRAGVAPVRSAGMAALWGKTRLLVELLARGVEEHLAGLGARLASPSDPARRGAHLAVAHSRAWEADQLLIERGLVVPDFRPPDVLRLGPVALYTRFVDVWDALEAIAHVLSDPELMRPRRRGRVT
jgi:kynureninase